MRVLITGARGFVGSHLAVELAEHDHEVIGSDKNHADLAEPGVAEGLVRLHRPAYVVHLAARYGRILCRDEPHRAVVDNAAATTELAAVCSELGVPVLYASSSEVYGDHGEATITEDSELRMPTTIYGLSKRWGEEALRLYMPPEKMCIVRANMLYGPNQRAGYGCCALATFIANAQRGEPITVHRDATRSWLYISDAVWALRLLIEGGRAGVFNLGNHSERVSAEVLAELVVEQAGKGTVNLLDAPAGQIRHKIYDSTKLAQAISWQPEVSLRDGIRQTLGGGDEPQGIQGDRPPRRVRA